MEKEGKMESDGKWTPGEWIVGKGAGWFITRPHAEARREAAFAVGMTPATTLIDKPSLDWFEDAECKANALLMAAAPVMYEALKVLDDNWSEDFPHGPDGQYGLIEIAEPHKEIWSKIRAALSRARGEV